MPLFFILSGFVYNKEKNQSIGFKRFALKQAKNYLIPYYVFSIINLCIEVFRRIVLSKQGVDGEYFVTKIKGILLCYSNTDNMPNCSPVWFLLCLFIAIIAFWWILKLDFRFNWIPIVICLISNYFVLQYCVDHTSFPFKFPTFLMAIVFLYIGYCLRRLADRDLFQKPWFVIASLFALVAGMLIEFFTKNEVGMNENEYGNYLVFIIVSVLVSVGVITIIGKLTFIHNNRFFIWLGRNTLYIIGFNYLCRDIATELYYYIPVIRKIQIHWMSAFILTFGLCLLCIVICTKTRRLFGYLFKRGQHASKKGMFDKRGPW